MGHNYIGTEHILLGLLKLDEGRAAEALGRIGVSYQDAYAQVTRLLEEFAPQKSEPTGTGGEAQS